MQDFLHNEEKEFEAEFGKLLFTLDKHFALDANSRLEKALPDWLRSHDKRVLDRIAKEVKDYVNGLDSLPWEDQVEDDIKKILFTKIMRFTKGKELTWEKEGSKIKQIVPECDCGTIALLKGSAGCPHEDNYTYTYQCPNCKNIEMFDGVFSRNSEAGGELEKNGWKMLEG